MKSSELKTKHKIMANVPNTKPRMSTERLRAVSYTHLDVYKRQVKENQLKTDVIQDSTRANVVIKDTLGPVSNSYSEKYPKLNNKSIDDFPTIFIQYNESGLKGNICLLYTSRCV